eukprot:5949730-Prymnesium_polylepis.1
MLRDGRRVTYATRQREAERAVRPEPEVAELKTQEGLGRRANQPTHARKAHLVPQSIPNLLQITCDRTSERAAKTTSFQNAQNPIKPTDSLSKWIVTLSLTGLFLVRSAFAEQSRYVDDVVQP